MAGLPDEVADAHNVLLCAPSLSGAEGDACRALLHAGAPASTSVLWVTFQGNARVCVDRWAAGADASPRNAAVVAVGDAAGVDVEWATVETVPSAGDLTGLNIEIGEFLSGWEGDLVVCFDSVTAMLQYVDLETTFEFLHAVTGQLYAAGARAHFHVDPTAHDAHAVESIAALFDAVVEFDGGDGDPEVRRRDLLV